MRKPTLHRHIVRSALTLTVFVLTAVGLQAQVIMSATGTSPVALQINKGFKLYNEGNLEAARHEFDAAIRSEPRAWIAYINRAIIFTRQKNFNRALQDLDSAIKLNPSFGGAFANRATIYSIQGKYDLSLSNLNRALILTPMKEVRAVILNNRAWLEATCPDPAFRDGEKAVADATKACKITRWKSATPIDTLAAAHAEAEDFEIATRYQRQAISMPQPTRDPAEAERKRQRLSLYEQKKPYRHKPGLDN